MQQIQTLRLLLLLPLRLLTFGVTVVKGVIRFGTLIKPE
jgi:hypothetical protein